MRKLHVFFFVSIAIAFGACSNDEIATEQEHPDSKQAAPQLLAMVEQDPTTKAGVIEKNNYILGEKFYWSNEDATTVFFRNSSMIDPTEYGKADYKAMVAQGIQSNSCTFDIVQSEGIYNGEYTVNIFIFT